MEDEAVAVPVAVPVRERFELVFLARDKAL
jgi:hypothetical protein